jgi:hypothetical protein
MMMLVRSDVANLPSPSMAFAVLQQRGEPLKNTCAST